MSEMTNCSIIALCQPGGRIIAANRAFRILAQSPESGQNRAATLSEFARLLGCDELRKEFEEFGITRSTTKIVSIQCQGCKYRVSLQKLEDTDHEPLVVVEVMKDEKGTEEALLLEAGRMTSRLIHDFKNQLGGLKLYAAYLKKLFSDQAQGLEITEKIIEGLNVMAEQAASVSKLTRPLDLKCERVDPAALVRQAISDQHPRAEARSVKLRSEFEKDLSLAYLDLQQLRGAIGSLIARAIDFSHDGGVVQVRLISDQSRLQVEIADQGETLSEEQRQALFDLPAISRINKTSLDLAMARRIIERHGGQIEAFASTPNGTTVQVTLKG
jgi:signal transduction histidine kinase